MVARQFKFGKFKFRQLKLSLKKFNGHNSKANVYSKKKKKTIFMFLYVDLIKI